MPSTVRNRTRSPMKQRDVLASDSDMGGAASDASDGSSHRSQRSAAVPIAKPKEKGWAKMKKRLIVGTSMIFLMCAIVAGGHLWTLLMVAFVQWASFRELVNVRYSERKFLDVPFFRTSQWAWFSASSAASKLFFGDSEERASPERASRPSSGSRPTSCKVSRAGP